MFEKYIVHRRWEVKLAVAVSLLPVRFLDILLNCNYAKVRSCIKDRCPRLLYLELYVVEMVVNKDGSVYG